ncbi:hypothetical protein [Janthinobacterium sp. GW458P]|uniref:hypothetical protein n=1 Tax=Janthinobacterium sp. GW458P TaxID=1981504 RepID=UPI000A322DE1|nr:hypothetical protein [Janthinobacterium sp. GW458P]MBE3024917.1 hypothetical protein [Janthinobacterium sp. GW458P]PHV17793.1 hypothetical protein CSQ90_05575 [Janthinobacterium sp. BJB303]
MYTKERLIAASLAGLLVAAQNVGAAPAAAGWTAVSEETLEQARGGFDVPGGLSLSFGIERLVSINGSVVSSVAFTIADVAHLSVEEASLARTAIASMNVVQNGVGNVFSPSPMAQTMAATVIQNSLNDQVLRTQTIVNGSVNSLQLLKLANFQDTLQNALGTVAGPK